MTPRMRALELANQRRAGRAEILRRLRAGELDVGEALELEDLQGATIGVVLLSLPTTYKQRMARPAAAYRRRDKTALRNARSHPGAFVRELKPEQRATIAALYGRRR